MAYGSGHVSHRPHHIGGGRHGATADESPEARFGRKVTIRANGCWAYNNDLEHYGQHYTFRVGTPAHRFAYETLVGPLDEGLHLHHKCENPGCVNPKHLEPMTPGDHVAHHARLRATAKQCAADLTP